MSEYKLLRFSLMTLAFVALMIVNLYANMHYHENVHVAIGQIYGCNITVVDYHIDGSAQTYCYSGIKKEDFDDWRRANALQEIIGYNVMYVVDVLLTLCYVVGLLYIFNSTTKAKDI